MKLAIYPGSFNPFHKGHYDILTKAERIFDKVIVARGVNLEKGASEYELPKIISNRTILLYNCLLTDCIQSVAKEYGTTPIVIRGLRNSTDLQYEMTQYRYLQDIMPDIQVISIFCDKEYDHISSSGIRTLQKYGNDKITKYLY
jgi:pantetheine-phosphate adenylyltransferase